MILKVVKYKCPSKEYRILSKGKGQNFLFKETLFKEKWTYILNSLSSVIFFGGEWYKFDPLFHHFALMSCLVNIIYAKVV